MKLLHVPKSSMVVLGRPARPIFPKRVPRSLARRAARMLARLKNVRGLSDDEKSVYALGLAATPEERWALHENFVRSLGYWKPLKRKRKSNRS